MAATHLRRQATATFLALCLTLPALAFGQGNDDERSLYDRLGGLGPISVVVDDFIEAMLPDELLNRNPAIAAARERVPAPYLKYRVTSMVCEVTGGPCEYRGRSMAASHAHLNITEREWDRMVAIFRDVLAEHDVPERETRELVEIIGSTKGDIVTADAER
ncbi:group I truncated hemoglobin [Arhodomonas sp. AD133]|uniref:group I truncated hemoglobin n=1 Tax=Arhodomonas sp. AD133 TaxID=3415009 RepID=UPI003EBECED7